VVEYYKIFFTDGKTLRA